MFLGTFLVCLAVLYFEILSVRTMSFVLGSGYIYFVIAFAMLGLSAAASMMSLFKWQIDERKRAAVLAWSCVGLGFLILSTFLASSYFKDSINAASAEHALAGGFEGIVLQIISSTISVALLIGLIMSVPYLVFGFIITLVFKTSGNKLYHKLYFADLLGGALGCVLAIVLMEYSSYAVSIVLPSLFCCLAAAAYARRHIPSISLVAIGLALALPLTLFVPALQEKLEPKPFTNKLARDYTMERSVEEIWRGWNSFSRVSALESVGSEGAVRHVMALGNGEGHATLRRYDPDGYGDWSFIPGKLAMALGTPEDVMVLFAGVGADMLAIDYYANGKSKLTGVELNRTMIEGAVSLPEFRLDEFYGRDNVTMHAAEARAFLERDSTDYDVILLSWSGATTSYYSGSMGHTTQFVYTREALQAIIDHLKPGGFIVYMNTNKVNTLAALRSIMEERGLQHPEQAAVVLYKPGAETAKWTRWWDENRLLIKPDGFSREDLESIRLMGDELGLEFAYAPGEPPNPEYWPYDKVLTEPDLEEVLESLRASTNLRFSIVGDDRPFSFDLFRTGTYFSRAFWEQASSRTLETAYERYRSQQLMFVGVIVVVSIVLILGPLLLSGGPARGWSSLNHLVYFSCLGAGFMLIEIGMMHKMSLLFGNPGLSIAVVLANLILFTGIGSYLSNWSFAHLLTFRRTVALLLVYCAIYLLFVDHLIEPAMAWSGIAKFLLVVVVLAPGALIMGHLFPQGLALVNQENKSLVPWGWAINGTTGTIAAGVAPLMAQMAGFNFLILIGAVCYAFIWLLPYYRVTRA